MFKKILESLTTQYKGVDARILTRMARKIAKQVKTEEDIKEAVEAVTMMDFIEMESDRKAAEAKKNAVETYEKEHNLINGKPAAGANGGPQAAGDGDDPDGEGAEGEGDGDPAEGTQSGKSAKGKRNRRQSELEKQIAALTETVTQLTGTISQMKQERTAKTRRQQVEELLEGADDKVKNRYMRDFDRLNFKDDDDFNQWLEERTPEITEEVRSLSGGEGGAAGQQTPPSQKPNRVTPPIGGRSTQRPGEVSAEVKAYLDAEAARENAASFSAIAGLPKTNAPTAAPV